MGMSNNFRGLPPYFLASCITSIPAQYGRLQVLYLQKCSLAHDEWIHNFRIARGSVLAMFVGNTRTSSEMNRRYVILGTMTVRKL